MTDKDNIKKEIEKIVNGSLSERREAVDFLSAVGADAVEPLTLLLSESDDNDIRWYASNALAKIGEPALEDLIIILRTFPDDEVRRYAAAALAGMGRPAVAELIAVLEGDDSYARGLASKALVRIGEPAIESLSKYIDGKESEELACRCAVLTLQKMSLDIPEEVEKVL